MGTFCVSNFLANNKSDDNVTITENMLNEYKNMDE